MMHSILDSHLEAGADLYGEALRYLVRVSSPDALGMIREALEPDFPLDCTLPAVAALRALNRPEAGEEALNQARRMVERRRPQFSGSSDLLHVLLRWEVREAAPLIIDGALLNYWSGSQAVAAYLTLADTPDIQVIAKLLDIINIDSDDADPICEAILRIGGSAGESLVDSVSRNHRDEFVRMSASNALVTLRGLPEARNK
jgi:hypothetical protein